MFLPKASLVINSPSTQTLPDGVATQITNWNQSAARQSSGDGDKSAQPDVANSSIDVVTSPGATFLVMANVYFIGQPGWTVGLQVYKGGVPVADLADTASPDQFGNCHAQIFGLVTVVGGEVQVSGQAAIALDLRATIQAGSGGADVQIGSAQFSVLRV